MGALWSSSETGIEEDTSELSDDDVTCMGDSREEHNDIVVIGDEDDEEHRFSSRGSRAQARGKSPTRSHGSFRRNQG